MSKVCQHGWMVWGGVTRSVGALEGGSVNLVESKAVSTPPESLPIICICLCLYNPVASKAAINPSPTSRVPSTPPSKLVSIHSHQIVRRDSPTITNTDNTAAYLELQLLKLLMPCNF